MRSKALVIACAFAVAIPFTGCGDDKKSTSASTDASAAATQSVDSGATKDMVDKIASAAGKNLKVAPKLLKAVGSAPTELVVRDIVKGKGEKVKAGATVTAHYTGIIWGNDTPFDSSWDRGAPAEFPLDRVVPGWTQGLPGMRVGGRRLLVIPSELGYGAQGTPDGSIPPDSPLVFVVDMKKTK